MRSFGNVLFNKDSIFVCKCNEYILSPYFIDHIYGITQFSLQNKAAGVLCLTLFWPYQTKGNMTHPLQKSGTCAVYIIYAICFCAALILRTCEPHSAYVQNVRRKQNIGHMCKMCAGDIHMQYVCSLRTILKICAKYAQFAHNPQDMRKICAVCAHKRKSTAPVAGHPSKHWARPSTGQTQCSRTGALNVVWSQTPTAIQEDLLYVQLHCLKWVCWSFVMETLVWVG